MTSECVGAFVSLEDYILIPKVELAADQRSHVSERLRLPENSARGGPSIQWEKQEAGLFGLVHRVSGEVHAILSAEGAFDRANVGWFVDYQHRGKGVGRAAIDLLVEKMKALGFKAVGAITIDSDQHEASGRLVVRIKRLFGQLERLVCDERSNAWCRHRVGIERAAEPPRRRIDCSLHDNSGVEEFLKAYGNQEFPGYVVFVDLVGSSEHVRGRAPEEVSKYYGVFQKGVLALADGEHILVDKTIGDEVLLVLPDCGGEQGPAADTTSGKLMAGLWGLQRKLGEKYRMRVGVAVGKLFLAPVESSTYEEWNVFGESVALAKRLHGLPELKDPATIACAFGALVSDVPDARRFENLLAFIRNQPWKKPPPFVIPAPEQLRGVGPARVSFLLPN